MYLDLVTTYAARQAPEDLARARFHAREALRLAGDLGASYHDRRARQMLSDLETGH